MGPIGGQEEGREGVGGLLGVGRVVGAGVGWECGGSSEVWVWWLVYSLGWVYMGASLAFVIFKWCETWTFRWTSISRGTTPMAGKISPSTTTRRKSHCPSTTPSTIILYSISRICLLNHRDLPPVSTTVWRVSRRIRVISVRWSTCRVRVRLNMSTPSNISAWWSGASKRSSPSTNSRIPITLLQPSSQTQRHVPNTFINLGTNMPSAECAAKMASSWQVPHSLCSPPRIRTLPWEEKAWKEA